jgi:hypothetical protein
MKDWILRNKTLIIVVLLFLAYEISKGLFGVNTRSFKSMNPIATERDMAVDLPMAGGGMSGVSSSITLPYPPARDYAPQANVKDRLVIQESNMSLLVKDVVDTRNKILSHTESQGGYMINASTSNPMDAPTSVISIRIPAAGLQATLDYFHSLSVKVVSENLVGRDVTDQYVDIEARITQIQKTKTRLEAILNDATQISDITNLTQQILGYQSQIDSLIGQQQSLEKNAELAKLTIYLSTDEIALPYAPSETFRPNVIFKLAVRSLVSTLRGIAEDVIWLAVYSVIWIPLLVIFLLVKRWLNSRNLKK